MKKAIAALLCACLLGLLCACAKTQTAPGDIQDPEMLSAQEKTAAASAPRDEQKPEEETAKPGKEPETKSKGDEDMGVITDPDTGKKCSANRLVVKAAEDAPEDELNALFEENGLSVHMHLKRTNIYVVMTPEPMNLKRMNALTAILLENEYVLSVAKDYVKELH